MELNLSQREKALFRYSRMPPLGRTKLSIQWVGEICFKSTERRQCEAGHSGLCIYKDDNTRSFTSSPLDVFTTWHLNKEQILQVEETSHKSM
jgi:hypothetical protein